MSEWFYLFVDVYSVMASTPFLAWLIGDVSFVQSSVLALIPLFWQRQKSSDDSAKKCDTALRFFGFGELSPPA